MNTKSYILDLLSRGALPHRVADLAGVTPAYVSQLQALPEFQEALAEKRQQNMAEKQGRIGRVQKIHDDYLSMEESLLKTLSMQVKGNLLRPIEQMKLLQIVASKKEPPPILSPEESGAGSTNVAITNISMPVHIANKFVLNSQKEIIGLENGTSFAPMSAKGLREMVQPMNVFSNTSLQALAGGPPTNEERAKDVDDIFLKPQLSSSSELLGLFDPEAVNEEG